MEAKKVTEVRIPSGRSISDQVISDLLNFPKLYTAVNNAPSTPCSEKEKNCEPKPEQKIKQRLQTLRTKKTQIFRCNLKRPLLSRSLLIWTMSNQYCVVTLMVL